MFLSFANASTALINFEKIIIFLKNINDRMAHIKQILNL